MGADEAFIDFSNVEPALHTWHQPHLVVGCITFFIHGRNEFANAFLRICVFVFMKKYWFVVILFHDVFGFVFKVMLAS